MRIHTGDLLLLRPLPTSPYPYSALLIKSPPTTTLASQPSSTPVNVASALCSHSQLRGNSGSRTFLASLGMTKFTANGRGYMPTDITTLADSATSSLKNYPSILVNAGFPAASRFDKRKFSTCLAVPSNLSFRGVSANMRVSPLDS